MKSLSMDQLEQLLLESGMAAPQDIAGYSAVEIDEIEKRLAITFPESYRGFLMRIGRSASHVFPSEFLTFPLVDEYRDSAYRMFESGGLSVADTVYVFLIADSQCLFFDTAKGPEPPVFSYSAYDQAAEKIFDSFVDWINDYIQNEAAIRKELKFKATKLDDPAQMR